MQAYINACKQACTRARAHTHIHTHLLYLLGIEARQNCTFASTSNGPMPCMFLCKQILHHGDQILAVDGRWDLTLDTVIDALKGDHIPGTSVTVTASKAETVPTHSCICVPLPSAYKTASKCAVCVLHLRGRGKRSK